MAAVVKVLRAAASSRLVLGSLVSSADVSARYPHFVWARVLGVRFVDDPEVALAEAKRGVV